MFCLSKRTVLFCCLFVVSLTNVAGHHINDELAVSSRAHKIRHHKLHHPNEHLLPKDCGKQNPVDKIYFGAATDIDEHPWAALLVYNNSHEGYLYGCSGSLISKRYVLTNANCANLHGHTGFNLTHVVLGAWNVSASTDCPASEGGCDPPHQNITIEEIVIHEDYVDDQHQLNDIALLRLDRDAEIGYFVKPICIPTTHELRESVHVGEELDVVGWGFTENKSPFMSGVKRKVPVPVISNGACARFYESVAIKRKIHPTQICAGGVGGRDSCRGDAGGPLMGRRQGGDVWVLFGIVSYGPSPCGLVGWPAVYTRVSEYWPWILAHIRS